MIATVLILVALVVLVGLDSATDEPDDHRADLH